MSAKPTYPGAWTIAEADLMPLAIGAALLGTGGGGNPHIGMLRARELMRAGARVEVLPMEALPDEAWVCGVGGIGAPVVSFEKIKEGGECLRALRAVEASAGITVSALISEEIGGANGIEPIATAARAGLPVVDGDGMGRAFPEVQMTTFFIYGQKPEPAAIADDKGNVVVFREIKDMFWLERLARNAAVEMGAAAGMCTSPITAAFMRRSAIPGTVTQALTIGRTLLDARARRLDVVGHVAESVGAHVLFTGKVGDIRRELRGGFVRGEALLSGVGDHAGAEGRIAIQNENLVLWVDGEVKAIVPDLIINMDLETGEPITTEVLRYGQRVAVLGLRCHDLMRTPEALEVVGPHAFGYPDLVYTPLADRRAH